MMLPITAKKVLVVSDIHGSWGILNELISKKQPDVILQVGDFGWWPHFHKKKGLMPRGELYNQFGIKNRLNNGELCQIYWLPGNHCLKSGTEVLTENGWEIIDNIYNKTDIKIAQFDIDTGDITFDIPKAGHKSKSKDIVVFNSHNMHQEVTLGHSVVYNNKKINAEELLNKKLDDSNFRMSGSSRTYVEIDDDWIKLLTWVVMDGTIVDNAKYNINSKKKRIQFKLSKQRKIDALTELLNHMNIPFTLKPATMSGCNKLQPYMIRIYSTYATKIFEMLNNKKQIPHEWRNFSERQVDVFLSVLAITDGQLINTTISKYVKWSTISKNDLDVVQEMCIRNNKKCVYVEVDKAKASGFKNSSNQYRVTIYIYQKILIKNKITSEIKPYNDFVYCFTTNKGTLITRDNGKVNFTGNSNVDDLNCLTPDYEPLEIQDGITYCPFGTVLTINGYNILFCGGAESTDKQYRIEGVSWWRDEIITQRDMDHLPERDDIDVVLSHTIPRSFFRYMPIKGERHNDPSTMALQIVLEKYRPKAWASGHFHKYVNRKMYINSDLNACNWVSLGIKENGCTWWVDFNELM